MLFTLASPMVLLRSGWTMLTVEDLKQDSLTVLLIHWGAITVYTVKMLELGVPAVFKVPSDFKEATALRDEWRSATTISGGQCVMISGAM